MLDTPAARTDSHAWASTITPPSALAATGSVPAKSIASPLPPPPANPARAMP